MVTLCVRILQGSFKVPYIWASQGSYMGFVGVPSGLLLQPACRHAEMGRVVGTRAVQVMQAAMVWGLGCL